MAAFGFIPVENFGSVPVHDALMAVNVVVDGFEIFYAVGLSSNVGMDGDGHDTGAVFAFHVETVKIVGAPFEPMTGFMVLKDHHWDVVEFDGVRQCDQWSVSG